MIKDLRKSNNSNSSDLIWGKEQQVATATVMEEGGIDAWWGWVEEEWGYAKILRIKI